MSTDYIIEISTESGITTRITLVDSINPLPGSDTWEAEDESAWDCKRGYVSSFTADEAGLSGPVGAQSIILEKFGKGVKPKQTGKGSKNYDNGTIDVGSFDWICISVDGKTD